MFRPGSSDATKEAARKRLTQLYTHIDQELAQRDYLMGDTFTVADGYLFVTTNWADHAQLDISGFAHLQAFRARVAARPAVQQAMRAEGLIKD